MKFRTLAVAMIAASSATAFAAGPSQTARPLGLAAMVAHLEVRYPGEVTAIQYDAGGDKSAHYHVDMRFPASGIARIDIDALTLEIASRDTASLAAGAATLSEVAALVAAHVPGQVTAAALDGTGGTTPHYDVDVRLPTGGTANLKIDPATRQIAWRNPAVVDD